MERGGSNGSQKQQKATSALKQLQSTYSINTRSNSNDHHPRNAAASDRPPPCPVREQDQYMPIANVIRIMRRILPPHAKISDDAKETMQECVSEYISFITGEANDRCQREQRKTITADDVLWAMAKLGFDNYIQPLNIYLSRYREVESDRNQPFPKRNAPVESGPMGAGLNFGPGYHLHQHHQSMGLSQPMWGLDGGAMGGYYRDAAPGGSASSSSHAALPNFDPYAQYK